MRIIAKTNGQLREAYRVGGLAYKCYPPGSNLDKDSKSFETLDEAALFLCRNPTWGIRMNPGAAIIFKGKAILLD